MRRPRTTLKGFRVLVVEDEYLLADQLAKELRTQGAEIVGPVPTVDGALGLIVSSERIDGAVLDINLRGEMAFPVADALARRGVPFVFATGYDAAAIPPSYRGVWRCEKPIEPANVARALFG